MREKKFVGRTEELQYLEDAYNSDKFEFCILYGRRRVGKTSLIAKFCEDKKTVFHMGKIGSEIKELETLSHVISATLLDNSLVNFGSFEDALNFLAQWAKEKRLLFVIDEFPYFANSIVSAMSTLQHSIDHLLFKTKLMIVLTGSSVSFMEQEILGHKSPLFGRKTALIHLKPLPLNETSLLCNRNGIDSVIVQAMTGGIPQYVEYFSDNSIPLEKAIENYWFNKGGLLYQEPQFLLSMETRNSGKYLQILEILASGKTKLNEIATKLNLSTPNAAASLNTLVELGIVEKEYPFGQNQSRKGIWKIIDPLFAFHMKFVYPYLNLLELGKIDGVMEVLRNGLNQYVGHQFERMCHTYFLNNSNLAITSIKRWWGPNPLARTNEEIDLVAIDNKEFMVFGECKWTKEKVGLSVFKELKRKSELVNDTNNKEYWLFSKSGFAKELIEAKVATLVSVEDLVRV
ncbi:MAG: ATP-binding protein [Sphaerochaetaceae bacterium]